MPTSETAQTKAASQMPPTCPKVMRQEGVGTGDEQVDAGMVEHFEHAFGVFCCQRVVQRGHKVPSNCAMPYTRAAAKSGCRRHRPPTSR